MLRSGNSYGGGLYSLKEPEHFTFTNAEGFKNYRGRIFATGTVTFDLTADDDRRIVDELSGAEITKNGNVYTVNLTGDAALDAAYHIQLHDGGDSYTNAEDNISVLGSAGDVIKPASGNLTDLTITNNGVVASYRADGSNFDSQITIGGLSLSQEVNSWSLESGTASFIPTTLAGAYLNGGEIAYQVESVGSAQVAISGISNLDGIADVGKVIEIDGSAVNDSGAAVALNSNGYQFNLTGDWSGKTFTATANADVITNFAASGLTITTGDGADTIAITGNVTAVNITDFSTDDRLEFASGISSYSYSDGALTVTLTDEQVVTVTGLPAPTASTAATWLTVEGGSATYGTPAGLDYNVEGKTITCASRAVNEEFVLSGLRSDATPAQIAAAVDVDGKTLKIKSDTIFDTGKKITAPNGYNFKITDTSGHYACQNGNNYALATTDNATGYSNLIRVYEVTLPAFFSVASGISAKDGGKTYATGEITLSSTKTSYTVASTATISKDTTIRASLDTSKHYIFGTKGNYQLATTNNVKTNNYPDLTQVYKVILPSGINVTSKYAVGTDIYVKAGENVTIAATDANKLIKSATVEGSTLANGVYTLTATKDLEVTSPILIWDFAKVFTGNDGTENKPYTLDTATKLGYLTDNLSAGEEYSGKYFSLTSGIGSDVKNIGNATNNFKGIATLGAGVKVSFNGGATIEAVSGEISFNASTSTFDSLNSGDKFKVGDTEYTVGDGCILQSGKVWLNPANVTLTELGTENNWTATVDGTITLTDAANKDFYGADGKKAASFDGTTLTKENDSSTTITAIDASALTTAITIDSAFYTSTTEITAGTGGVNVNVGDNKFSVVSGAFKFDGSKLLSGTAKLSAANDAVKVGDKLITLTSGDGITVNATDSTIGGLNSGDKFKIGTDSYEVTANGIIKNDNFVHATANTLTINDTAWKAATIITDNASTLGSDTLYIDSTAKQVAKLENGTLTAINATDAAKLTVNVGTGKEYTLGKEFSNLKSGSNSFKVTASGNYKVNGTTITLANV